MHYAVSFISLENGSGEDEFIADVGARKCCGR